MNSSVKVVTLSVFLLPFLIGASRRDQAQERGLRGDWGRSCFHVLF
jgi:hypothetical protein